MKQIHKSMPLSRCVFVIPLFRHSYWISQPHVQPDGGYVRIVRVATDGSHLAYVHDIRERYY